MTSELEYFFKIKPVADSEGFLVVKPEEVHEYLVEFDDGEEYTLEKVQMIQAEVDALPEWNGW